MSLTVARISVRSDCFKLSLIEHLQSHRSESRSNVVPGETLIDAGVCWLNIRQRQGSVWNKTHAIEKSTAQRNHPACEEFTINRPDNALLFERFML